MKLAQEVQDQLSALAEAEGFELVSTEVVGSGSKTILRLIVDSPKGVDLDRCAEVSRQASAILDVEDPFNHPYTLEVSSPGLDRKFYSPEDFVRFAGRRIKVRMLPSYREHRSIVGELLGSEDGCVRLKDDSGEELDLPFDQIFEARLEVDWNSIMKEGKSRP